MHVHRWELDLPQLLLITDNHIVFELLFRAFISIYPLVDENGLYRCVSEDYSCSEQAIDTCKKNLNCKVVSNSNFQERSCYTPIRFHLGTSNAPIVGSSPVASVHVPTGLKLILRCLESGLASRLHGSCSSIAVTRCDNDMLGYFLLFLL